MTFYQRWIGACAAGELVGIGVATLAALAVNATIGEPQSLAASLVVLAVFALAGGIEGTALAGFEWRVLHRRLPQLRPGPWIGATVAVAVAGWIAGMAPSLFVSHEASSPVEPPLAVVLAIAAAAGAAGGLLFGAVQWLILRRYVARASRWIWIHIPAWALAMAAIFLGASLPTAESPAWWIAVAGMAGGLVGGLLLGAVTGLVARTLQPGEG